jgi:DedD protein
VSARSARERRAAGGGLGWFTTLGGAALLLAFGFGIGLVAGSALEEPDLVASHLSGEATELPLPAQARSASPAAPEKAAAPTDAPAAAEAPSDFDAGDGRHAPAPAPAPRSESALPSAETAKDPEPARHPPLRAPAPALASRPTGFAVQVGAFADRRAADELVGVLQRERFRAYVVEGARGDTAPYRVRVGPYPTREKASDEAARLHARRRLPTWVIAEGGT